MKNPIRVDWWLAAILGVAGFAVEGSAQVSADDPGAFREISFETEDGGLIFGNLYGEGTHAIVLGHGAIFDKESWDDLATRLSREGYQALAIDFRGYGKSTAGRRRSALHEDILGGIRYLSEQGATRVSVIGASMGGGAAGDAAARAEPGEIDRLIPPRLRLGRPSGCRATSSSSFPRTTPVAGPSNDSSGRPPNPRS